MRAALWHLRPRACLPPLWREITWPLRAVGTLATPKPDVRTGVPVLLIPGLFAGDAALARLGAELAAAGHRVHAAGIGVNVDCAERGVSRVVDAVRRVADESGEAVALVGHSRGGLFARAVAQRRPQEVAGVVTLGSPHRDQLSVHPILWVQIMMLGLLGTVGLPGLLRLPCAAGRCCERFRDELAAAWPADVGLVSVYSRRDGVVDWRACLDPRGRNVEVASSHCGMVVDPLTYVVVRSALERFGAAAAPAPALRAAA